MSRSLDLAIFLLPSSIYQARLFDFSRKFNEAARVYYELSNMTKLDEEDRLHALYVPLSLSLRAPLPQFTIRFFFPKLFQSRSLKRHSVASSHVFF
jgi:hypothetical protein